MTLTFGIPRFALYPEGEGQSAGSIAGGADKADTGTGATPPATEAGASGGKQDGGSKGLEDKSPSIASGGGQGDGPEAAKETPKEPGTDAGVGPVEIKLPDAIPDGVTVDQERVAAFARKAGELKLTSEQASAVVAYQLQIEAEEATRREQILRQYSEEQKQELCEDPAFGGKNFPKSSAAIQRAIAEFSPGLGQYLDKQHMGNDPVLMKFLAAVGHRLAEDTVSTQRASDQPALSKQEIRDRKRYPSLFAKSA